MWLNLQIFGFRALWSPYFLLFVISLGIAYYLITFVYRNKIAGKAVAKPTGRQLFFFYTAIFLLYIVKGAPVDLLSHIMLTFHMAQLAIFLLVFPMFIIMGIPEWLWRKIINIRGVRPTLNFLTKPLISIVLFNGLFSFYHIPVVFDFAKSGKIIHVTFSLILLLAAFVVWWPILTPLKEFDTIQPLLKIAYVVGNAIMITPACVLIILASEPLFASYSHEGTWIQTMALCVPGSILDGLDFLSGAEMFSPLSTIQDQQLGGVIMKTMQEIIYGTLIGRIFFKWFKDSNRKVDGDLQSQN